MRLGILIVAILLADNAVAQKLEKARSSIEKSQRRQKSASQDASSSSSEGECDLTSALILALFGAGCSSSRSPSNSSYSDARPSQKKVALLSENPTDATLQVTSPEDKKWQFRSAIAHGWGAEDLTFSEVSLGLANRQPGESELGLRIDFTKFREQIDVDRYDEALLVPIIIEASFGDEHRLVCGFGYLLTSDLAGGQGGVGRLGLQLTALQRGNLQVGALFQVEFGELSDTDYLQFRSELFSQWRGYKVFGGYRQTRIANVAIDSLNLGLGLEITQ